MMETQVSEFAQELEFIRRLFDDSRGEYGFYLIGDGSEYPSLACQDALAFPGQFTDPAGIAAWS